MTITRKLKRWMARAVGITIADLDRLMDLDFFGAPSATGVTVTERGAFEHDTISAIVKLISEDIADLPLHLMETDGASRRMAVNHPVFSLIKTAPNPKYTAFSFRQTMLAHALTWGNAFALIVRDTLRRPRELWILDPSRMKVAWNEIARERGYSYWTKTGQTIVFTEDEIFHYYGLSFDGVVGLSPVQVALRQTLGLAVAMERYGSVFFDSPIPFVALKHPNKFQSDTDEEEFWRKWNEAIKNKKRFVMLKQGLEIDPTIIQGMPNDAAQFLQSRRFQKEQQAMWYRVPRHMLQDIEQRAQTSVEQQNIEYVVNCLDPWATNFEQAISLQLLRPDERSRFFAKHNFRKRLRGDAKAESEYLNKLVQSGLVTPNEARAWLDLDPAGPEGDKLYMQVNMAPLDMLDKAVAAKVLKDADEAQRSLARLIAGGPIDEERKTINGHA